MVFLPRADEEETEAESFLSGRPPRTLHSSTFHRSLTDPDVTLPCPPLPLTAPRRPIRPAPAWSEWDVVPTPAHLQLPVSDVVHQQAQVRKVEQGVVVAERAGAQGVVVVAGPEEVLVQVLHRLRLPKAPHLVSPDPVPSLPLPRH